MIKHMKSGVAVAALAAVTLCAYAAKEETNAPVAAKESAQSTNAIVASGKGVEIKRGDLDEAVIAVKADVAARGQSVPESMQDSLQWDVLQDLVFKSLLLAKATPEDKTKGKEDYDKFVAEVHKNMSDELFTTRVKAMGMTMEQFQKRKLDDSICSFVLDRELKSKVAVTDEMVKKFYTDNPDKFETSEQVRASHILISTMDKDQNPLPEDKKKDKEKLAKEVKAKADKGEDFAALAKQYSDDPGSKDKGGEYTFGRGQMVPAFEAAAFSLKTNQISDLVETPYGYHIIKLSEKIPAGKRELAKVSEQIKEYLVQKEVYSRLPEYREKLSKEADVKFIGIKEPVKAPEIDLESAFKAAETASKTETNKTDKK
jgi:parvulin-like peptidyl-prolyl isomerase